MVTVRKGVTRRCKKGKETIRPAKIEHFGDRSFDQWSRHEDRKNMARTHVDGRQATDDGEPLGEVTGIGVISQVTDDGETPREVTGI